jgi:hypothetical protein
MGFLDYEIVLSGTNQNREEAPSQQAHKSESGRGFGAGRATARHELVSSLEVGMHSTAQKAQGGGGGHNGERRTRGDDSIVATDVRVLQVYIGVGVLVIY